MTLLWWSTLLLCVCASAEKTVLSREPGQSVTLECSSAGCLSDFTGYKGMYMYFYFREREEVLYYYPGPPEKITPRAKYNNRVQKEGSLMNHNITISNLTVDDSGVYSCIYKKKADSGVTCNIYILVVRVPSKVPFTLANEKCPPSVPSVWLVLIIVCISLLVTMLFILFIIPRVKQWTRRVRNVPQVSSDYVYEVMNKNGFRPPAAPEGSSLNPYDFESY